MQKWKVDVGFSSGDSEVFECETNRDYPVEFYNGILKISTSDTKDYYFNKDSWIAFEVELCD